MKRALVIVLSLSALVLTGCADASAKITTDTTIPHSPPTASTAALIAQLPSDTADRHYGVVTVNEGGKTFRLETKTGPAVLLSGYHCPVKDDGKYDDWWKLYLNVGDAVSWTTKGDDAVVCPSEVQHELVGAK